MVGASATIVMIAQLASQKGKLVSTKFSDVCVKNLLSVHFFGSGSWGSIGVQLTI